jgi:hypothetical protein
MLLECQKQLFFWGWEGVVRAAVAGLGRRRLGVTFALPSPRPPPSPSPRFGSSTRPHYPSLFPPPPPLSSPFLACRQDPVDSLVAMLHRLHLTPRPDDEASPPHTPSPRPAEGVWGAAREVERGQMKGSAVGLEVNGFGVRAAGVAEGGVRGVSRGVRSGRRRNGGI